MKIYISRRICIEYSFFQKHVEDRETTAIFLTNKNTVVYMYRKKHSLFSQETFYNNHIWLVSNSF